MLKYSTLPQYQIFHDDNLKERDNLMEAEIQQESWATNVVSLSVNAIFLWTLSEITLPGYSQATW